MTSMSHQHHQAMTSWHPANANVTAITTTSGYHNNHNHNHHHHNHHHHQHNDHEPSYPLNMDIGDSTNSTPNQQQYNQPNSNSSQRTEHHQLHSATSPDDGIANLTSDISAPAATLGSVAGSYMPNTICRKTSPTLTTIKSPEIMSPTGHHHLQDGSYQDPSMMSSATHHDQRHQIYQQHQQHATSRIAQVTNNNYYESNYQECHQDYYNMIHHQNRALDPFQHHHSHHHHHHHQQQLQQQQQTSVGPQVAATQCWPNQLTQSTSPQIPTSPAVLNQFHIGTHQSQPNLPAPVSPYASATYTNGYHQQHQHYVPHQHHQNQSQQNHQAIMQSQIPAEDVYTQQNHHASSAVYNQFSHRGSMIPPHVISQTSSGGTKHTTSTSPMHHVSQITQHQPTIRHYTASANKVPTTTSETIALNTCRASSIGANSSPKLHQNMINSSGSVNSSQICRRQPSSVVSTSSAGSNLSDHHSPTITDSPSSVPPSQTIPMSVGHDQTRQDSIDDRLSTNATDTEQDSKESQLSQLHQQCAVLLDEQQQQHNNGAINSPNSNNNNGTNASNSTNNGNNSGRSKRLRTSFKHNQLKEMKRWFSKNQNPDAKDLKTLAQTTGLSKRVLQVWFQNARAKYRRNNAKVANQQLYDVNSHMLQFQQHQQQNYLHHHHHHTRPITDQPMNSQQQSGQNHHLISQGNSAIARTFVPLSGTHQVVTAASTGVTNLVDQPPTTIHHNLKQDSCD